MDLLGKSDARIAKKPMRKGVQFYPGDTKWSYDWSIAHLQPDPVAGLVRLATDESLPMPGWGDDQIIPGSRRGRLDQGRRVLLEQLLRSTPEEGRLIARDPDPASTGAPHAGHTPTSEDRSRQPETVGPRRSANQVQPSIRPNS